MVSDQLAAELAAALRENTEEVKAKRLQDRALLPTFLDDKALRLKFSINDNKQLRALLELHRVPMLAKGRGFKVLIEDALRVEACLRRERVR
jgi:hypothetical protein